RHASAKLLRVLPIVNLEHRATHVGAMPVQELLDVVAVERLAALVSPAVAHRLESERAPVDGPASCLRQRLSERVDLRAQALHLTFRLADGVVELASVVFLHPPARGGPLDRGVADSR